MPKELDSESGSRVEHEILAEYESGTVGLEAAAVQPPGYQRGGEGLVELCWVERDAERHAGELVGTWVGEGDGPRTVAEPAPAAAGSEAAKAADGVAQCDTGRKDIDSFEPGKPLALHVEPGEAQRSEEAAIVDAGGEERIEREDASGISQVVVGVQDEHQNLGAGEPGEGAIDGEVRDLFHVEPGTAGQTGDDGDARQEAKSH